ncbi:MAG: hypothetical protein Q4G65_07805, partial [bacterium]|nr:hypothetical protein [bacterium]
MDNIKNIADYEIADEKRLEKACQRGGWISTAHVSLDDSYFYLCINNHTEVIAKPRRSRAGRPPDGV